MSDDVTTVSEGSTFEFSGRSIGDIFEISPSPVDSARTHARVRKSWRRSRNSQSRGLLDSIPVQSALFSRCKKKKKKAFVFTHLRLVASTRVVSLPFVPVTYFEATDAIS